MNDRRRFGRYGGFFRSPSVLCSRRRINGSPSPGTEKTSQTDSDDDSTREPGKQVTIRKARSIDKDFVISLGKQLFEVYGPYERAISLWFDHETTSTFIAESDHIKVGFVMLGPLDYRWETCPSFELLAIGICPSRRKQGIGNGLMEAAEKQAAQQGLDRIFLHTAVTNYPAQRLFYRRGYRPWGLKPRFYPAGQDAMVMSKHISPETRGKGVPFEK